VNPAGISVSDAIAAPELFGPFFAGSSWDTWKSVVKAMFGEPLNVAELARFRAVAERNPPSAPVREMAVVAGRGAGKDSVATVIAAVEAVNFNPRGKLRPGERAVVMLLAVDREQAKIALGYIAALFREIPALTKLVVRVTDDSIVLNMASTSKSTRILSEASEVDRCSVLSATNAASGAARTRRIQIVKSSPRCSPARPHRRLDADPHQLGTQKIGLALRALEEPLRPQRHRCAGRQGHHATVQSHVRPRCH
jgi:hypothetical protein